MDLSMNQPVMDWPESLMPDAFRGLDVLRSVSARGQKAAGLLLQHGIWNELAGFDPIVAGTFPINLDIVGSDVDILCYCPDADGLEARVQTSFGYLDGFGLHHRPATQHVGSAIVVRFVLDDLPVEIFATGTPSQSQFGFRHMLVEARVIALLGERFASDIRQLKRGGVKTEPAFARLLKLGGDPYIALDGLYELGPDALRDRVMAAINP
jgi:hypothetical protein